MARSARLAVPGELHHLIQCGHNGQPVFDDDEDRAAYLAMLHEAAAHYGVAVHAYALLGAEVHLLVTPNTPQGLGRLMQSLGRRYVAAYNRRHGRSGTLWAGRFRAGLLDGAAAGADAIVHVESMPVRAGLASSEAEWPWSSAAHHLGRRRDPIISEHPAYWALGNTPFERELAHAHRLREGLASELHDGLRASALRGKAFGSAAFIERISASAGLKRPARRPGRPQKSVPI